ncbi:hypothetical protein RRG08_036963 [Elysia crispata]|uniref:Uncharacterized protein n=1 Tax=Elysia crispata TaxID=231223 RepID=A0AAE0XTN6_9GAST|nr:hypothetical protein RRG08_036963 [Elysia crispata]
MVTTPKQRSEDFLSGHNQSQGLSAHHQDRSEDLVAVRVSCQVMIRIGQRNLRVRQGSFPGHDLNRSEELEG